MAVEPPPMRPTSMSAHKLTVSAAKGRGEPIVPRLFVETDDPTGTQGRHVTTAADVVRGLGLPSDLAARVERMVTELVPNAGKWRNAQGLTARSRLVEVLRPANIDSDVRQEIERRAFAFWRRSLPGGTMRHVIKSSVFSGELRKAGAHKYISRKPDGRGGWKYEYAVPADGDSNFSRWHEAAGKVAELKEGDSLQNGNYNGLSYARKIHKIEHAENGDTHFYVSASHDSSGNFQASGASDKTDKYTAHADGSVSRDGYKLMTEQARRALLPHHSAEFKAPAKEVKEKKAKGAGRPGTEHITVERKGDGSFEVKEHASKKDAQAHGMERRRAGADINAHSKADAEKFGLDPRTNPRGQNTTAQVAARKGPKLTVVKEKPKLTAQHGDARYYDHGGSKYRVDVRHGEVVSVQKVDAKKGTVAPSKAATRALTEHVQKELGEPTGEQRQAAAREANATAQEQKRAGADLAKEVRGEMDKQRSVDASAGRAFDLEAAKGRLDDARRARGWTDKDFAQAKSTTREEHEAMTKPRAEPAKPKAEKKPRKQKMTAKGIDHPPDAGPGKINVRTGDSHMAVEAQKFGNYAVHRRVDSQSHDVHDPYTGKKTREGKGGFTVTHMGTGNPIHHAETKLEAQKFAQHMHTNAPDHFAGAKFGQTDFSAFPTRAKEFQEHIANARDASVYKSMAHVLPASLLRK